jgi:hypothetical protein
MDPDQPTRPRVPTAVELCVGLRLNPAALALLDPALTPRAYVDVLIAAKLHVPAIEVVAHVLPRRLSLWWAMLCAHHATAAEILPHAQMHLFRLALRWLQEPAEPARAAAEAAAREAGAGNIGGLLCLAAAMHARPEGAVATANAVKLASTKAPPPAMREMQRAYAVLGLNTLLPEAEFAARSPPSMLRCA